MVRTELIGTSSDPADNVEHSFTFPTGYDYKVKTLNTSLVTDANAANRDVTFIFKIGSAVIFKVTHETVIPASKTVELTAGEGMPFNTAGNLDESMPLPDNFVVPGGTIVTTETVNRQATDNFGIMYFYGQKLPAM